MMNTDIDHWKTTLPYGGDFTTFKALRLNLLISTTNNPPKKKVLGESPRIHQAFHRKFTVLHQGKPGPGPQKPKLV